MSETEQTLGVTVILDYGGNESTGRSMGRRWTAALLLFSSACDGGDQPAPEYLDAEALLDPQSCASCHPAQMREWSGSMHAYASDDPVFLALNARGQRETGGELGNFCVQCHAPMAVLSGATTDGLNLQELPQHQKGITCYFCHSVDAVLGTHNNPLRLANDGVMRGGIPDPIAAAPHRSAYSPLHDRKNPASADLCGSCHDVVTPAGVFLERTYAEWQASLFAKPGRTTQLTCGQCHMEGREGPASTVAGSPMRLLHDHAAPAVDVAMIPFPERETQRALVQNALDKSLLASLCVRPLAGGVEAVLSLDNAFGGHAFTSGAAHNRRAWAEVVAYAGGQVIYESGVIPQGQPVAASTDPDLWRIQEDAVDAQGNKTYMFWDIARTTNTLLPPAVTNDPTDPAFYHQVEKTYRIPNVIPDRITVRVHIRPMDFDLIDTLVESGDLDPAIRSELPTFTLRNTEVTWTPDRGFVCVP
ncbi:multiheme c-type cytochrome [Chondromyces crocatus]|nr:multiheme c-type cytochrome [Chondromyces crocatus]